MLQDIFGNCLQLFRVGRGSLDRLRKDQRFSAGFLSLRPNRNVYRKIDNRATPRVTSRLRRLVDWEHVETHENPPRRVILRTRGPMAPVVAPMIAAGLPFQALSPCGREAQSASRERQHPNINSPFP